MPVGYFLTDRILRIFRKAMNSFVQMVKAWRERSENSASPVESTLDGPWNGIKQGRQAIIQKLADNAMKHDGTSMSRRKSMKADCWQ